MVPFTALVLVLLPVLGVRGLPCDPFAEQLDSEFCLTGPPMDTEPMTFAEAEQFCQDQGAILVIKIN